MSPTINLPLTIIMRCVLGWERLKVGAGAVATIVQNRKDGSTSQF
jgi:hypothetical protein